VPSLIPVHSITCQRGSASQCCIGDERFLWKREFFRDSPSVNPLANRRDIKIDCVR
jgi:hypothetical protein